MRLSNDVEQAAIPYSLINSSIVLWMSILWMQPHKVFLLLKNDQWNLSIDLGRSISLSNLSINCSLCIDLLGSILCEKRKEREGELTETFFQKSSPRLMRSLRIPRDWIPFLRSKFILSLIIVYGCVSLSRSISLIQGYSAPIHLYLHSNTTNHLQEHFKENSSLKICYGKDWFRFPSHFLLPEK